MPVTFSRFWIEAGMPTANTPATTGRIYTHLVDRTHEETLLLVSAALK